MTEGTIVRAGVSGLRFVRAGRVRSVVSPTQLRILLAIEEHGTALPVRQVSRLIWPGHTGALTASQRASAARSVTRLLERELVAQQHIGATLTLTPRGRGTLTRYRVMIAEALDLAGADA